MNEIYRTMDEIKAAFPNEWVLIDRPKSDRYQNLKGGYVVAHSKNEADLEQSAAKLPRPFHITVEYTGEDVEDGSIFLLRNTHLSQHPD